ncbi:hypothetical protein BJY59DRAFT_654199, partial [Rhodotorula toruloides]
PLDGIALAEARAVHDAIMLVLERNPDLRRLLVRSDSASSVYAFDSGSAKDDIQPLVSSAYDALRQRKVDLRIEHIPGDRNVTADKLSRLPLDELRRLFPHFSTYDSPATLSASPSRERAAQ